MAKNDKIIICPIEFEDMVQFTVLGKPFAKQRPRVAHRGRFSTIYTPRETKLYEAKVKKQYLNAVGNIKMDGPLIATIKGTFSPSKSTNKKTKKEMLEGNILHTQKPDCDNMGKICLDALNDVAYNDDSQICKLNIEKVYGEIDNVNIKIKKL